MRETCVCLGTVWKGLGGMGHVRRNSERRKLPLELKDERIWGDQGSVVRKVGNVKEIVVQVGWAGRLWQGNFCRLLVGWLDLLTSISDQSFPHSPLNLLKCGSHEYVL